MALQVVLDELAMQQLAAARGSGGGVGVGNGGGGSVYGDDGQSDTSLTGGGYGAHGSVTAATLESSTAFSYGGHSHAEEAAALQKGQKLWLVTRERTLRRHADRTANGKDNAKITSLKVGTVCAELQVEPCAEKDKRIHVEVIRYPDGKSRAALYLLRAIRCVWNWSAIVVNHAGLILHLYLMRAMISARTRKSI